MDKDIRLKVKEIFEDTKKKHLQEHRRKKDRLKSKEMADAIFSRRSNHRR